MAMSLVGFLTPKIQDYKNDGLNLSFSSLKPDLSTVSPSCKNRTSSSGLDSPAEGPPKRKIRRASLKSGTLFIPLCENHRKKLRLLT